MRVGRTNQHDGSTQVAQELVTMQACPVGSPFLFLGHLPHRRESLVSGRRVKGREAIACDAVGALDAPAATGTLIAEEDGTRLAP